MCASIGRRKTSTAALLPNSITDGSTPDPSLPKAEPANPVKYQQEKADARQNRTSLTASDNYQG